jgi:alkylated DNA repair dioxygenase AlkB
MGDAKDAKINKHPKTLRGEEKQILSPQPPSCMEVIKLPLELVVDFVENGKNFESLWNAKLSERGNVKIYGKEVEVPRYQKSFLRDYTFSGLDHKCDQTLPAAILPLWQWAQDSKYAEDGEFNQCLVNWYENGNNYIGAHSDDESQLVENSTIISISLGATRKFRIRSKDDKNYRYDVDLESGTAAIMMDDMQKRYKHEIVKVSGKKGAGIGRRINVTFRKFK